jgi:hypothetical protein
MNPSVIVLGEAKAEDLHYYPGWNTITQNLAGDIAFECLDGRVDVYVSSTTYSAGHLYHAGGRPTSAATSGASTSDVLRAGDRASTCFLVRRVITVWTVV